MGPPSYSPMPVFHPDPASVLYTPSSPHMQPPSAPPVGTQLTDVAPTLFCPFYPDGLQAQAHKTDRMLSFTPATTAATVTAASASTSATPAGSENGDEDDYRKPLDALAVTQGPMGTWGASSGERYVLEEVDIGASVRYIVRWGCGCLVTALCGDTMI
jgi:hypothetical protein